MHSQMNSPLHLGLVGGGSGGHVFPALAVAEEAATRGWQVSYFGREKSMESRLVASSGLPFCALSAKPWVGQGPMGKISALLTLAGSAIKTARNLRRLGVDVLFGTGGYVAAPAIVGARLAGAPVILLEPNAVPGQTNQLLGRLARGACISWEETAAHLPCPTAVTGVPVRRQFFETRDVSSDLRLLVLGGSQGSQQLNELMEASYGALLEANPRLEILHQAGRGSAEALRHKVAEAGWDRVQVVEFLEEVASAMAASHLILSRAGAITLAEVTAVGRASLLIPLKAAGDHQKQNAEALVNAGAAAMLWGQEIAPNLFLETLQDLLGDRAKLEEMASAAFEIRRPRAASAIADQIETWGAVS